MMVFYVAASVLGLIGITSLANLANLGMFIFLALLVTWLYVRYSGEHRQLGVHIDQLADLLWENVSSLSSLYIFHVYVSLSESLLLRGSVSIQSLKMDQMFWLACT